VASTSFALPPPSGQPVHVLLEPLGDRRSQRRQLGGERVIAKGNVKNVNKVAGLTSMCARWPTSCTP
jgi:hypothetical protein